MTLAENIKRLREKKGFSVRALAREAGVSQPYLRQLENSNRANPSGAVLQKIASVLGVTIADLMGAPVDVSQEAMEAAPKSLQQLMKAKGKALGLRQEDVEMLSYIHYRGKRPRRPEDYELLFMVIQRILE